MSLKLGKRYGFLKGPLKPPLRRSGANILKGTIHLDPFSLLCMIYPGSMSGQNGVAEKITTCSPFRPVFKACRDPNMVWATPNTIEEDVSLDEILQTLEGSSVTKKSAS
jgi:hypothetical protein